MYLTTLRHGKDLPRRTQGPATTGFWRLLPAPDIDLGSMQDCGKSNGPQAATKTTGSRVWHLESLGQWLFINCMEVFHYLNEVLSLSPPLSPSFSPLSFLLSIPQPLSQLLS